MNFVENAWKSNSDLFNQIIYHPFWQQIANGTLASNIFCYYIVQDTSFLQKESDSFIQIASNMNEPEKSFFLNYADDSSDLKTYQYYNNLFSCSVNNNITYSNFAYSNYLLATSYTLTPELGATANFPCSYLYYQIGQTFSNITDTNIYKNFLDTNTDPSLINDILYYQDMVNAFAANATNATLAQMTRAFNEAMKLEYKYINDIYNLSVF